MKRLILFSILLVSFTPNAKAIIPGNPLPIVPASVKIAVALTVAGMHVWKAAKDAFIEKYSTPKVQEQN